MGALSNVTVRGKEETYSNVVTELEAGNLVTVVKIGKEPRRVMIRCGETEGWISSKTQSGSQLLVARTANITATLASFDVDGQYEATSAIPVAIGEGINAAVSCKVPKGTVMKVLEIGKRNDRRAKVQITSTTQKLLLHTSGWVSLTSVEGEAYLVEFFGTATGKVKNLLEGSRKGDLAAVKKALSGAMFSTKIDVNSTDTLGKTALIYACEFGHVEIVEHLLALGNVKTYTADDMLKNALHHAAKRPVQAEGASSQQAQIAKLLLQSGLDAEARDRNGCTALMFAAASGNEEVAKTLISGGANADAENNSGQTAYDYACQFNQDALIDLLAPIEVEEEEGEDCAEEDEDQEDPTTVTSTDAAPTNEVESLECEVETPEEASPESNDKAMEGAMEGAAAAEDAASPKPEVSKGKVKVKGKAKAKAKTKAKPDPDGNEVSPKAKGKAKAKVKAKTKGAAKAGMKRMPTMVMAAMANELDAAAAGESAIDVKT